MKRRQFLAASTLGAAAAALARPALAQASPELKWRLDLELSEHLRHHAGKRQGVRERGRRGDRRAVSDRGLSLRARSSRACRRWRPCNRERSRSRIRRSTFSPPMSRRSLLRRACLSASMRASRPPGGPRAAGASLIDEVLKPFGAVALGCGNTGAQMGGWFRKEVKTPADFNELKMRIGRPLGPGSRKARRGRRGDAGRRDQISARERRARCRAMGRPA